MEELILEEQELLIEEEALFLNREMLTEVKNLIDDINERKSPNHLKQFIHPQWGSILGSEEDIRLAVLQDEIELLQLKLSRGAGGMSPHDTLGVGYHSAISVLENRIKELS